MSKYKLLKDDTFIALDGTKLFRIKATKSFNSIRKGDLGGYISSVKNLDTSDNAWVYGDAWVYGNALVSGNARVQFGTLNSNGLIPIIASSLNVYPANGTYRLYKRVNKKSQGIYQSVYDANFIYKDGEIASVERCDEDKSVSCGSGIHVSTPFYCDNGDTLIAVDVHIDDVITCQTGKLRCRKVTVIGECNV